ncbi:MAG: metallophosphoesterase [Dehalococcoidales bacterium]|nr:metallophosphoesterase [Dehalococcoidales bacterium]
MSPQNRPARRLLHTSDLHLLTLHDHGCRAFAAVIDLALKERADLLLIAGDFFDQNRIADNVLDFVKAQISRLHVPVVILPGNHDCLVEDTVYNKRHWLDCPEVLIFRDNQGETLHLDNLNISVWGKPIDTYFDVRPLAGMPVPAVNGNWNIAAAHGLVVKQMPHYTRSYIITEEEIDGAKWDYIALGHTTIFEHVWSNPVTYYSGSATEKGTLALVDFNEETGVKVTRCEITKIPLNRLSEERSDA